MSKCGQSHCTNSAVLLHLVSITSNCVTYVRNSLVKYLNCVSWARIVVFMSELAATNVRRNLPWLVLPINLFLLCYSSLTKSMSVRIRASQQHCKYFIGPVNIKEDIRDSAWMEWFKLVIRCMFDGFRQIALQRLTKYSGNWIDLSSWNCPSVNGNLTSFCSGRITACRQRTFFCFVFSSVCVAVELEVSFAS